jgi:hypothetical protein
MQIIDKTIAGLLEEIAAENPLQEAIPAIRLLSGRITPPNGCYRSWD